MEYYDAHVHFVWKGPWDQVRQRWQLLHERGLRGMAGIIFGYYPRKWERFLEAVLPPSYQKSLDKSFFEEGLGFQVSIIQQLSSLNVFPYLDCRFIDSTDCDLTRYYEAGFKGLKVLYIPDGDDEFGRIGWKQLFGYSEMEYRRLVHRMIEQAFSFGWPIIFHADLRRYANVVSEILQINPGCPFIIPHFGFSRKLLAKLFERFNCCYTDFSSLLPFMQNNPDGYLDFMTTYNDRILFGSDALLGQPELTVNYLEFIITLVENEDIRVKIMCENYLHIHSIRQDKVG